MKFKHDYDKCFFIVIVNLVVIRYLGCNHYYLWPPLQKLIHLVGQLNYALQCEQMFKSHIHAHYFALNLLVFSYKTHS